MSTPPTTAELWPNRLIKPSVRDIISFRTSMPDMTPAELGQVADLNFRWQQRTTITSGDYVRGVTAGYDFARKEMLEELSVLLQNVNIPGDRLGAIKAWVRYQVRPPVTQQHYEN